MADLASAANGGTHLEILKALRDRLIRSMDEASPGVIPQYAKQISDLSREISELEPKKTEATQVDDFHEAFESAS
ncbi:hypothetical protein ACFXG4_23640 [Nocardia sp. NPDC059246]|uniref:hypothetical protein n=1 Tax=unclassified Nocardia TaxID=2637762 RepID=UPI0036BF99E4